MRLYTPLVHSYCLQKGLQEADAWDVTQEVFASVCGAIGRFDYQPDRGKFRSWLIAVTCRKINDFYRRLRRCPEAWNPTAPQEDIESGDFEEYLANIEREYRQQLLDWATAQLRQEVTERTWKAFEATALHGRPGRDVAEELGTSVGAVHLAKCRSSARLREILASGKRETDFMPSKGE